MKHNSKVIKEIKARVQSMREEGETDLRSLLSYLDTIEQEQKDVEVIENRNTVGEMEYFLENVHEIDYIVIVKRSKAEMGGE